MRHIHRIVRMVSLSILVLLIGGTVLTPFTPAVRAAGPWYVSTLGSDNNNCLSPDTTCATINAAIGKASAGDEIRVATGTYTATAGVEVVLVTQGVKLSGGWNAAFTTQGGMAVIDGQAARRGVTIANGVTLGIDHFIFQNGKGDGMGGGLYNGAGTVTLEDCRVSGNTTYLVDWDKGGGIYNGSGTLTLTRTTVSGNSAYLGGGIFNQGGALTLNDSIVNGNTAYNGGGIFNQGGALTLNDSTINGNQVTNMAKMSGGIWSVDSTVVINHSWITANDGGLINSSGMMTITASVIDGNKTGHYGGGIDNGGVLVVTDSTVSNNAAANDGGGIINSGTATLTNSTVSGNKASSGGGIMGLQGSLVVNSSTISANTAISGGGAATSNGTITLRNTILAGNVTLRNGPDCSGAIGSAGYNLVFNTAGCAFSAGAGDLTGVDPQLGERISTPAYYPLLPTSPAVDAGNPGGCTDGTDLLTTDQRGAPRAGRCDIGAYEYTPPSLVAQVIAWAGTPQTTLPLTNFKAPFQALVLDSLGSPVPGVWVTFTAPASGPSGIFTGSLSQVTSAVTSGSGLASAAVFTANGQRGSYLVMATVGGVANPAFFSAGNLGWYVAPTGNDTADCATPLTACATINAAITKSAPGDTILIAAGGYSSAAGSEVVRIDRNTTLSGGWNVAFNAQSGRTLVDGQSARRGITVNSDVTAFIDAFDLQNGSGSGGGIYNDSGSVTLTSSLVRNNSSSGGEGAGIYNASASVLFPGAIHVINSTISGNTIPYGSGGAISNHGVMTLDHSTISGNTSAYSGGGITNGCMDFWCNYMATLTLNDTTVSGNTSQGGGGLNNGGVATLNNSTVSDNTADRSGGGLVNSGVLVLNNTTVSGNTSSWGGGIRADGGTLTLNNSTVTRNKSTLVHIHDLTPSGGGIFNFGGTEIILRNSIVSSNITAGVGPDCRGSITSQGYNLIGSTLECDFTPADGDQLNTNPKLGPMLGSPAYYPLMQGSPAIDAGNPAGCQGSVGLLTTDQRGSPRPLDGNQDGIVRCDIGAYEVDPVAPFSQVFLPVACQPCQKGICGQVTLNGVPAAGVSLELRFYTGSAWLTAATVTTNANGEYGFTSMPGLSSGQLYYVRYRNYANEPGRLWVWGTRELRAYKFGAVESIGNFDIADIGLVSPSNYASTPLPAVFQWTRRPTSLTDSYEFDIYDPYSGYPYAYVSDLGYINSIQIISLPPGFVPGKFYVWEVWVHSPDGGYGISAESRWVSFSSAGAALQNGTTFTPDWAASRVEEFKKAP